MEENEARFIGRQKVAHLASADGTAAPHVVPICFVLEAGIIYTAIDAKPKRVDARGLRRVRNILENPQVALVFDRYVEDWGRIGYVMVMGRGTLTEDENERLMAERALRDKYPQYHEMLPVGCPVIRITPSRVVSWGNLDPDDKVAPGHTSSSS
ncbi:MAG: TIGR03668 family PPOX class F420-dependent oxidoreductase [SAR202 cluster bacterium]|jgi:PPOX class probable F420-dependent enzyme|nr:TIGR03668 family PPOX class F420-dependent oxidoreductase [SAR202 cluster bacterium]MDP6716818.1 TIGR03668 family PPOX class F420-dependent oxidoreductase [SAR202 cluster bacterium]